MNKRGITVVKDQVDDLPLLSVGESGEIGRCAIAELDDVAAEVFQALVQVLRRDHDTRAGGERLDGLCEAVRRVRGDARRA